MLNLRKFSHTSPKLCYLHLCNSLTIKCPLFRQGRKNWWEKLVKQNTMLICYKKKLWEIFNYVWARLVDLLLVYRHCMSVLNSYFADAMSWLNELLNQSVGNRETQFFFFTEAQVSHWTWHETNELTGRTCWWIYIRCFRDSAFELNLFGST